MKGMAAIPLKIRIRTAESSSTARYIARGSRRLFILKLRRGRRETISKAMTAEMSSKLSVWLVRKSTRRRAGP